MNQCDETPRRLRDLPRSSWLAIALLVLASAVLRVAYQWDRAFTGDEAGTLVYIAKDYRFILTHFLDPWLSMNVYLCLVKFMGQLTDDARWALVLPTFVAGLAAIPLAAAVALRVSSARVALIVAALVAFNPTLVHYGVQIRAYSIFVFAVLAMLLCFLDWREKPDWKRGAVFGVCAFIATITHLYALYYLACIALFALYELRAKTARDWLRLGATLAVPAGLCAALAVAVYLPILDDLLAYKLRWSAPAPTPIDYLPVLNRIYFGAGAYSLLSLVLLGCGLWLASQKNHRLFALILFAALPHILTSFTGSSFFPWAYARMFLPTLVILLFFIAVGADGLARSRQAVGWLIVAALLASWVPALRDDFKKRKEYPWLHVQKEIHAMLQPGDHILTPEGTARVSAGSDLLPYFPADRFVSIPQLSAGTNRDAFGIIYVATGNPLRALPELQRQCGLIQITAHRGETREAAERALLAALQRSVRDGRLAPGLTGRYRTITELLATLNIPDTNATYATRYHECLAATQRVRHSPPQFLTPQPDGH